MYLKYAVGIRQIAVIFKRVLFALFHNKFIRISFGQMHRPYYNASSPKTRRFPQDISCILQSSNSQKGSLFISNIEAAQSVNTLRKHKIGAILGCAHGYRLGHSRHVVPHYLYIPGIDHDSFDLSVYFDRGVDFITERLQKTNVLVHCVAGVSRSVSMVVAYFIRQHHLTFEQAYRKVKGQRSIIYPNDGFIRQLKLYALEHHKSRSRASSANRSLSWSRRFDRDAYSPPKKVNRQNEVSLTPDKTAKHAGYFNSDKYEYRYFAPQTSYKEEPIHASARPESRTFYSKSMAKPKKYEEMQFFPIASTALKEEYLKTEATTYTPSYFKSLNAELEDKIDKIKSKYDGQWEQLTQKYPTRPESSQKSRAEPYYHHIYQYDYVPKYSHLLKTEASETRTPQRGHQPYIDSLFPGQFYLDRQRTEVYRPTQPKTESAAKQKYNSGPFNRSITSYEPRLNRRLYS